jgi:hypothetical protein
MNDKKKAAAEWLGKHQTAAMLLAFGLATIIMFPLMLFFKNIWMPNLNLVSTELTPSYTSYMQYNERYMRGCMEGTTLAAIKKGGIDGRGLHPRLYKTLPFLGPFDAPENETLWRIWRFCNSVYSDESNAYILYQLKEKSPTLYTKPVAIKVRERINQGWVIGGDAAEQRALLDKAIDDWDDDNLDSNIISLINRYIKDIDKLSLDRTFTRIFEPGKGRFDTKDICTHKDTFIKWNIVEQPDDFFAKIGCGK